MDKLDSLIVTMRKASRSVRVGILGDEENATKAMWNELGTVRAPARPFLSTAAEVAERRILEVVEDGLDAGSEPMREVEELLKAEVLRVIDSNVPPPLADSTLEARRARGNSSSASLVDTGAMRKAITSSSKQGAKGWD